jgi:hypothetical protein
MLSKILSGIRLSGPFGSRPIASLKTYRVLELNALFACLLASLEHPLLPPSRASFRVWSRPPCGLPWDAQTFLRELSKPIEAGSACQHSCFSFAAFFYFFFQLLLNPRFYSRTALTIIKNTSLIPCAATTPLVENRRYLLKSAGCLVTAPNIQASRRK